MTISKRSTFSYFTWEKHINKGIIFNQPVEKKNKWLFMKYTHAQSPAQQEQITDVQVNNVMNKKLK